MTTEQIQTLAAIGRAYLEHDTALAQFSQAVRNYRLVVQGYMKDMTEDQALEAINAAKVAKAQTLKALSDTVSNHTL